MELEKKNQKIKRNTEKNLHKKEQMNTAEIQII